MARGASEECMVNDALVDELPLAQRLALSYAPIGVRAVTLGLLALDARLAAILRARREPIAAQLRFAWWRERLEEPGASWPHGEPVLDALRAWGDASGLAVLPAGWEALLADRLTDAAVAEFAETRGESWACLARELSTHSEESAARAGRIWAAADLAGHLSDESERKLALAYGFALPPVPTLPTTLRALAVLAGLARRSLVRGGAPLLDGPAATLLALRIGVSGR